MIPVFYRPEQNCADASSFSPSAGKPAQVMRDWLGQAGIAPYIKTMNFEPLSRNNIALAHQRCYVDGVLDSQIENGFGNTSPAVAASLPYTTGSIVAAAEHVLLHAGRRERLNVAVSPTSGFHHASYDHAEGFCTFNGLMIAAIHAHQSGLARRVAILDFDQHYGNGTDDIIRRLGIDFVDNFTAQKTYRSYAGAYEFAVDFHAKASQYDLILYQAGADIHVDDPLGGMMTTEQMHKRDKFVFSLCATRRIPLVWNLAGGYQRDANGGIEPVLALHRQTMEVCLALGGHHG